MAIISYLMEMIFVAHCASKGAASLKGISAAIVIPSAMIFWMLKTSHQHCPGFSLLDVQEKEKPEK